MPKKVLIIIAIVILLAGSAYYWFFLRTTEEAPVVNTDGTPGTGGFTPIDRNPFGTDTGSTGSNSGTTSTSTTEEMPIGNFVLPKLRKLSSTPVSGLAASTTASSSIVRWMDRGTGHVYEASNISAAISKISNTTLPKIYESYWNRNATASVIRYLREDTDVITNFYAELRKLGTSTSEATHEIKGKFLSPDIKTTAVSPTGDRIFTLNIENDKSVGYISEFDESRKTRVFDTPITQATIEWPETNTLTINTNASGMSTGFIYSIDTRNGVMKKVLGGDRGLFGRMSHDGSQVLYSKTNNGNIITSLFNIEKGTAEEVILSTLADKCVWSNVRKTEVYCAVPTEIPTALYPDDWYKGNVSFIDQIWHLNASTGEVHLLANLLNLSDELIDVVNLTLDPEDDFLYFMNKRDLSLWVLDLNQ